MEYLPGNIVPSPCQSTWLHWLPSQLADLGRPELASGWSDSLWNCSPRLYHNDNNYYYEVLRRNDDNGTPSASFHIWYVMFFPFSSLYLYYIDNNWYTIGGQHSDGPRPTWQPVIIYIYIFHDIYCIFLWLIKIVVVVVFHFLLNNYLSLSLFLHWLTTQQIVKYHLTTRLKN